MRTVMRVSVVPAMLLSVASILVGCGRETSPPPQPAKTSAPPAQSEAVQAAIKEGALNWIDAVVVAESAKKMAEAFKKHYGLPESFQVNFERLGTGPLASRVQEEVKAGRITVDLFAIADPVLLASLKEAGARDRKRRASRVKMRRAAGRHSVPPQAANPGAPR